MESYDGTPEQRPDGSVNLALNVPIIMQVCCPTEYTNKTNIYLLAEVLKTRFQKNELYLICTGVVSSSGT